MATLIRQQPEQVERLWGNQKTNWGSQDDDDDSIPPPERRPKLMSQEDDNDSSDEDEEVVEYDSDGCYDMTNKQRRKYYHDINKSDGFDVQAFPKVSDFGLIRPVYMYEDKILLLTEFSESAIKLFNGETGQNWKFVKLVKANSQVVCGLKYYITFVAEDTDKMRGDTNIFQAVVVNGIGSVDVEFCRLKPTT